MQDDELLTVDEVAAILKIHPRTVRGLIANGSLSRVLIGKRDYRIRRNELNRFIRERESRKEQPE